MKSIIFIAPPAAGKGTVSELLKAKYALPHISTGDLLREAVLNGAISRGSSTDLTHFSPY